MNPSAVFGAGVSEGGGNVEGGFGVAMEKTLTLPSPQGEGSKKNPRNPLGQAPALRIKLNEIDSSDTVPLGQWYSCSEA